MSNVEKISIALPAEMVALVKQAVTGGEYSSSSEVIRDALRAWKYERALKEQAILELRSEIQKGIDSGIAENFDIEKIISDLKKNRN